MAREVQIGSRYVGDGHPAYIVSEIGVNHNGSIEIAKDLIKQAYHAGVDAVKFQKRTPEQCVPKDQWELMRETPWGYISYIEYRRRMEFQQSEYAEIDRYCQELGMPWFASVWDEPSVEFLEPFNPICYKIPSASLTDHNLLNCLRETGRPVILSTGMSTMEQIHEAVKHLDMDKLVICHATSTYPCDPHELNLHMIETLRSQFPCPIGYSGQPKMATLSASSGLKRSSPCSTQESGSIKAACSKLSSPILKTTFSGAVVYCSIPPGRVTPTAVQFRQKFCRLFKQASQLSQAMLGSTATRSPGLKRVTWLPTASTTPENSCPGITG